MMQLNIGIMVELADFALIEIGHKCYLNTDKTLLRHGQYVTFFYPST